MTSRGSGLSPGPASVGRASGVGRARGVGRGRGLATSPQMPRAPGAARSRLPVPDVEASVEPTTSELLSVKAHITALASTADKDDIIAHFSSVCDKTVEIASPIKLGGGKAEVVLKGISVEDLQQLRVDEHKIKGSQVEIEFKQLSADDEGPPPLETESDEEGKGTTTIEVANVPSTVTIEALQAFFESPRSGGQEGGVSNIVTVKPGIFHVTFHDPAVAAQVMSEPRKLKREKLQMKRVEEASSHDDESNSDIEPNKIEVHNVPDKVTDDVLKAFFEMDKSGGSDGAIDECRLIRKGVFILTFRDPRVAAQVMSRSHQYKKIPLKLQYVHQVKQKEQFQMNQLVICGLPDGTKKDVYELKIAGYLDMDEEEDFQLEIKESSAVITFAKSFSAEELKTMMDTITSKQKAVTVEMVKVTEPSIHVSNITTMCDKEFLQMYFGNTKWSGGGEIEEVTLLGENEARVTFVNSAVIQSVLDKEHSSLGPGVVIKEYGESSSLPEQERVSLPTEPLEISLDPLLVQSIQQKPRNLEHSIMRSQVTFSADEEKGMLIFSPTGKSQPNWHQECQDLVHQFLKERMTTEKIDVPKEAASQVMRIVMKLQKENPSLRFDPNSDGTEITVAGETSCVLQAKQTTDNLCAELVTDSVSIPLSPEDYDFAEQVKCHDFPDGVEYAFDPDTFSVTLKGPVRVVVKLKGSMEDTLSHTDSPVMLEPLVAVFFETQTGRGKLEKFLRDRQCCAAIHFSHHPNLTLHLLSDRKEASKVKAVVAQLPLQVTSQAIQIPGTVQPILSDLEDFVQLCQNLEKKHGVLIKQVGHEISAAGFKAEVSGTLAEISKFLSEKASPIPALEIKVGILIARSLHKSPHRIQKCLQPFNVQLHCNAGRDMLLLTPLHYLKPGWEEACKNCVSEYIQSNIAEVKIGVPEKAYSDVMTVLYSSEQDDGTLVYHYPPQATTLSLAGEPNIVKLTEDKISQICANHSYTSDELALTPEQFEFLNQLKMQDVTSKYQNVEIEPVPENHSVTLSGPTKQVKTAKESIVSMAAHATVPVQLDEAIIHFLASEKGKDRLFRFLRDRQFDKCAVFISESPVKLSLLCALKHKPKVDKVSKALIECTSVAPLQIPHLLQPFLPELPEFSDKVRSLERDVSVRISIDGNHIVVAGFKDGASQATDALSTFVREKMVHFQPIPIPIDPMIAKCMQGNLEALRACMSSIHVTCTLKQDTNEATVSVSPTKVASSDWKGECKKLISSYIDKEYLRETIEIPKVAVKEVFPILFSTQTKGHFIVESSDDGSSATIAGKRSVVNSVRKRINNICSEMQTSESISFKPREYDFFTQIVQQSLDSKDTTIACSPDSHSVKVSGSIHDVSVTVKLMMEAVQHVVVPVMVDECIVHFIHTEGKQDLEIAIQRKRITAAIHTNMDLQPPTLELLCHKQYTQQVESLAESFPKKIETMILQLPETITESPVSHEFQDHYQQLAKKYRVSIQARKDKLQICGFKDKVDEAKKAMKQYIKQKCTISRSFPIQKGMWRLLYGPMRSKWSKIQANCRDKDVVIKRPSDEEEKCIITLQGDKVQVLKIIESMNRLVQSIQIAVIRLVSPEIRRYFKEGEDGGMKIPGIEKNAHVCIEICKVGEEATCIIEEDDIDSEQPKMKRRSSVPRLSKQCTAQVVDMKSVTIYVGDITEVRVDVIVNAANEELKHIGGVADAILKKGGQEIQVASDRYVRSQGRLTAGEVWMSTVVGKLPCLALIHAVGPRWQGNRSGKQLLKKVYMNCLQTANAYTSIALPAISSGVFGCPMNQCAEIAISTIIEYCNRHRGTSLDDINIVLYQQSDVHPFVQALKSQLPSTSVIQRRPNSSTQISDSSIHATATESGFYPNSPQLTSKESTESSSDGEIGEFEELVEPVTVGDPTSLSRVFVQQGSILDVEAEIYVNSTNGNMDLSGGAVAQALAKAAGPALQAECTKKAPIAAGEIAVTGPGKIRRCKCIIHINCPGYDQSGGQAEDILRKIMNRCMKECDKRGASTIVFPAIGTGNLRFPVVTAAHIMVDEVCNYLEKNKCKSLSMVYFIIFMENMYRTFCDELQKRKQAHKANQGSGSSPKVHVQKVSKPKKWKKKNKKTRGRREEPADTPPQSRYRGQRASHVAEEEGHDDQQAFDLGNGITLQIVKGDITTEKTDVIVNTTSPDMILTAGVGGALLKRAGSELQKACNEVKSKKKKSLSEGKVIDTKAGNLQCKRVFHIVFQKSYFVEVVHNCIEKARELNYSSIAFPGIGTGTERYPPEDAAKEMIKGLQQGKSYNIHVRIILIDDKVYKAFKAVIDENQLPWYQRAGRAVYRSLWGPKDQEDEEVEQAMEVDAPDNNNMEDIELRIFGETEQSVKSAEDSVHSLISKQFITDEIEDERINLLKRNQESTLQNAARRMQLTFRIDRNLNSIELKGSKEGIAEMKLKVFKELNKAEKDTSRKAQAETMMKTVQWKRQDSTETEYDPITNLEIEESYQAKDSSYTFEQSASGEDFTIFFGKMEEVDHAMRDKKYKVKRITIGAEGGDDLPDDWDSMVDPKTKQEVPLCVVDLAADTDGYKFALAEFHKTMTPGANYTAIVKIERIQNPALYRQYAAKKKQLKSQNPPKVKNECWLFHGTKESSVSQINKTNFNRSFRGQNGTVYGQGCYFARDASYSNRYSSPDGQGQKCMYLVRVLTGEYTQGANAMIVAPPKDPSDATVLYDSVVDNTANPTIFVVFYDADAYPEFLITYK